MAASSPTAWTRRTTIAIGLPDARRSLQLGLAGLWLWDGVLQLQPFMFTPDFARQVTAPSAQGNPAFIAGPITAVSRLVAHHSVGANAGFAVVQVVLGLGIAWRPTVKPALVASICWALAVWWLGEGLGGVLTGLASPVAGGPGAALLYALLAVLLWPPSAAPSAASTPRFVAAGAIGAARARLVWLGLWAALAGFALSGADRSGHGLSDVITGAAIGQPAWLAGIDNHTATLVSGHGLAASIGTAVVCAAIAVGGLGSARSLRVTVAVAAVFAVVLWVAAQALGMMLAGQSTDPNSGPLLLLIAAAYWPLARPDHEAGAAC